MRQSRIANAAIAVLAIAAALIILEIGVRVLNLPPRPLDPLPVPAFRLSENPILLYEYQPGFAGRSINSAGFRDREREQAKPDGTTRVVVLGDSTTVGNGIGDPHKIYTRILEAMLNEQAANGLTFEVLNLGVDGYQTLQEAELLRTKGVRYEPDIVLVTLCVNDFYLHSDGEVYEKLISNARHGDRGEMLSAAGNFLLAHSRLAFALYHGFKHRLHDQDQAYRENFLKEGSTVETGFRILSEAQKRHGFQLRILILPAFTEAFDDYDYGRFHERVFQAAKQFPDLTVIDLLPHFAKLRNDASHFAIDDGIHMNERAPGDGGDCVPDRDGPVG